jgi:hypothetical protein
VVPGEHARQRTLLDYSAIYLHLEEGRGPD